MGEAKFRVSLTEGTLEIEGSESFVAEHLAKFEDTIQSRLGKARPVAALAAVAAPPPPLQEAHAASLETAGDLAEFYAVTDAGIQILGTVPGTNNAEKTVNAAAIQLYGLKKLKNKDTLLFEEVKPLCKSQGCYDGSNMAKYLKGAPETFIFGGSGKKQTIQLTQPGFRTAEKLLATMKAANEAA